MPDIDKLLNAIDSAEEYSYGAEQDSELEFERAAAIDFYHGKNVDPAPEGRSQVVDRSVFETIQWILPSLCRIFAGTDNVVEFVPFGPEDEDAAEQESDFLNYLVTQKSKWFEIILTWFQDALLTKNAYCMPFMEEKLHTETESYKGQSEEALALLLDGDGVEVTEHQAYPDENDKNPQPAVDEQGQPILDEFGQPILQPRVLYDVTIRRTKPSKCLQFVVLPPERCKVSEHTPDHTLNKCNYFEYFEFVTISELRAQGYEVDDDIASDSNEIDSEVDDARDLFIDEDEEHEAIDPAMRRVRARTIWIKHDYDEDGIAELIKVVRVGREILAQESASRIPVACIVPAINTHRHIGISVADQVADIQTICTTILRQGLDNLYQANNPRNVINDQINLDDMLVSRPGGVVRSSSSDVRASFAPIVTPFVFPQAMAGLEYMDQVKEKRTGVSKIFQGIDEGALNQHDRIGQLSTMASQRIEQIARIFASGVETLFSLAHELVIKSGHQSEAVKLRGEWVQIDPAQWKTGRDMRVVASFAAGNKDTMVARLATIMQMQEKAMLGGLPIVTPQNVYETGLELIKASDFTAPEKFLTDPSQIPPKPPPPDYTQIALDLEKEKTASAERVKQADTAQHERDSERDAQVAMARAKLDSETRILLQKIQAGEKVNLEAVKQQLHADPIQRETQGIAEAKQAIAALSGVTEQAIGAIVDKLDALEESANAPKQVVRDKSGRVTGIQVNGKTKSVKRDDKGNITGAE